MGVGGNLGKWAGNFDGAWDQPRYLLHARQVFQPLHHGGGQILRISSPFICARMARADWCGHHAEHVRFCLSYIYQVALLGLILLNMINYERGGVCSKLYFTGVLIEEWLNLLTLTIVYWENASSAVTSSGERQNGHKNTARPATHGGLACRVTGLVCERSADRIAPPISWEMGLRRKVLGLSVQ